MVRVWGADSDCTARTVDTHIKTLRAKLHAIDPHAKPMTCADYADAAEANLQSQLQAGKQR
jgi:hypothetical protein